MNNDFANIFISYSRIDKKFAERLVGRLTQQQAVVWIDWEDILPSTDWWSEIESGIENANVFLFLISPDSITSKVCKEEITHAIMNGKRLIPVVVRDISPDDAPSEVSKLNWIFFRESDDFEESFRRLDIAIHVDFEWVKVQSEVQVKALKWERQNFEKSYLLRGKELKDAELWFQPTTGKDPAPTELQIRYVRTSREYLNRQRKSIIMGLIFLIILVLGYYIWQDRTWFRIWPISRACPNVSTAAVEIVFDDFVMPEEYVPDELSTIKSETNLQKCLTNVDDGMGIVQVNLYSPQSDDEINLSINLPQTPAYQMDFLPEIRRFSPDGYSTEDAVSILKATVAYSVGNYDDVIKNLEDTTHLAGKILLAQAYMYADEFELSRKTYSELLALGDLSGIDPSQLRMGFALAMWYPQISDKTRSNPDLYNQNINDCNSSYAEYKEVLQTSDVSIDWRTISDIEIFYCWHEDKSSLIPLDYVSGNPFQDLLSALILIERGDTETYSDLIINLLESSNNQLSISNLELSKFYLDLGDCDRYRHYLEAFKKTAFSDVDRSTVQYYYYDEKTCWPFILDGTN